MSLMEILDKLTIHCELVTGKKCELKLALPTEVLEDFGKIMKSREKLILTNQSSENYYITKINGNGGTIELLKEDKIDTVSTSV